MKHNIGHYFLTFIYILLKSLLSASVWIILSGVGYLIYNSKKTPFDLIIGLPLMLLSIGLFINNIYSAILALFAPIYNKGVCPLCSKNA
jgi:uncharacterized membrane protein YvlD (DUF360 family)